MTGVNVISSFPKYTTVEEANKLIENYDGIRGIVEKVAEDFSLREITPMKATAGDCVILSQEENSQVTLALVGLDGRCAYGPLQPKGWARIPLSFAIAAWRI